VRGFLLCRVSSGGRGVVPFAPAVEEMQEAEPLTAEKVLFHPRSDEKAREAAKS